MTERHIFEAGGGPVCVNDDQQMFDTKHGRHGSVILPILSTVILPDALKSGSGKNTGMIRDILERIDKRLKKLAIAESAAALQAGLSDSAIRNIRRAVDSGDERKGISTNTIVALAPVLKTTAAWLLEERGPENIEDTALTEPVAAKLISWVSAGKLAMAEQIDREELDYLPTVYAPDLDPSGDWIALRVDGDSMNKISPHDSIIFVNRKDRRLVHNACYVIGDGEGGATYKRFRTPNTWEPVSTNPVHQPFVLPEGQEPDIVGRVRKTILAM